MADEVDRRSDWFRRAVIYEVLVGSFCDSDADGCGDLAGLRSRLDYLQWLGVTCLWLPPIYTSPLRDGGYDISDHFTLRAEYGGISDLVALLGEAHERGIRVLIDLVMNHTSDSHPWFQRSRLEPDGPYGDFYVWSDSPTGYADARIIFVDTETSNWAYDPVRGQYYWHRFFSHQPDLNYENLAVQRAILDVVRFWLDLGVDGFRLDAVPYLFEQEGTDCENLPATHEFLRLLRKIVDDEYPGRVLLAEANQRPTEVSEYFGHDTAGDECHMAFHFPLMPSIFVALRSEEVGGIRSVLRETPEIPSGCQWATFLRNHDELTLEMVDEDVRAFLYREYAPDDRMRSNVGIRRRLAPLLDNDPAQQRLAMALLLGLPGTPVLYYGDEIGMGDNIWLPDRDGVRTPMQWSPDRNAGFSTADPGRLVRPVVGDAVFGYQSTNVEAQLAAPASLLHWTRSLLRARRENPVFAEGELVLLEVDDPAGLAFLRRPRDGAGGPAVLCVHNFSASPRALGIDLSGHDVAGLVALDGGARFPATAPDGMCRMTLAPRGYYWLAVESAPPA